LRHCKLPDCSNYFLSEMGRSGHPRECCSPAHSEENTRLEAKARAQKWRDERKAPKRGARKK
jgi:hypothetical protein